MQEWGDGLNLDQLGHRAVLHHKVSNRVEQPTSRASTILAVWLVEPKASPELKCLVSLPWGKLQMIANMFSPVTGLQRAMKTECSPQLLKTSSF